MNRKTLIITAAAAAAAVIAAFGLSLYITYKKPNTVKEGVILIYRDADYQDVEDSLKASGTIKNLKSFGRAPASGIWQPTSSLAATSSARACRTSTSSA